MNELVNEIEAGEILDRQELAVVKRVKSLEPIQGKDFVELVHLEDCGYTVVCEKIHKVGDIVVFIKYDTIVPNVPLFSFMESFKFRVKPKSFTLKDGEDIVGKIYSQGIVLPINDVLDYLFATKASYIAAIWATEGQDLTTELGVTKYVHPVSGGSGFGETRSKGNFPTHIISKTDELNLASKVRLLEEIQGKDVYVTLKIEGSSLTTYYDEDQDELVVCSRNNMLSEVDTNKFWIAANKYNLKEKLKQDPWLVLQGELYGEGIQKNKLGIKGVDLMVFSITDKRTRKRFGLCEMVQIKEMLGIQLVPVLEVIRDFGWSFDKLQSFADTQVYSNGVAAEGIVVRPEEPFYSKILQGDFSCKVINREYKL